MSRTGKAFRAGLWIVVACTLWMSRAPSQVEDEWNPGVPGAPVKPPPWLFKTVTQGAPPAPEDPRFSASRAIEADLDLLRSAEGRRARITLLDDTTVVVARERVERRPGGLVWFGHIEGEPGSNVVLSLVDEILAGSIRSTEHPPHLIDPVDEGLQFLHEIDFRSSVPEAGGIPRQAAGVDLLPRGCGDPSGEVDVMVLYTPKARNVGYSGPEIQVEAMEAKVYLFLAESNESFLDSDVDIVLRLIHLRQVEGVEFAAPDPTADPIQVWETSNIVSDTDELQSNHPVRDLRDFHGADLVVLLAGPHNEPGASTQPDPAASASHSDAAYSMVDRRFAESQLTFTHEIGHLFGADHNCDSVDPPKGGEDAHGFDLSPISLGTTLMSTTDADHRLLRWSDPNAELPGNHDDDDADDVTDDVIMLGTEDSSCPADNHAVLNAAAKYVSDYRCSSLGRDDVWMKDTWFDTGEEPYVLLPGEVIWDSPYLWVRRSQDPDRIHQHEHQDPTAGAENWIYVKLQNGRSTFQSGELELYWADSSTSLLWPGGWTLLASTHVSALPPSSATIIETEWDPTPSSSSTFCLLARWNSAADPMTTAETADIYTNVSHNNNLIWRNLDIVQLFASPSIDWSTFHLRDFPDQEHDEEEQRNSLVIDPPKDRLRESFVRDGRVYIRFDAALLGAWERGGRVGRGFKVVDDVFVLTPELQGSRFELLLPRETEGIVQVGFERLPTTPRRNYRLDIRQLAGERPIGGMSYEIQCARPPREQPVSPGAPPPPASGGPGG